MKTVRRGYLPEYDKLFGEKGLAILREAAVDTLFLLNRGYSVKRATQIAQEHYQLAEIQRLSLARCLASDEDLEARAKTMLTKDDVKGQTVYIDGFNAIIPMESLVSASPIFKCMDGAIRDMANLKGAYKVIDKTEPAIKLILAKLDKLAIKKAIFNFDSPVSNSGRLKTIIGTMSEEYNVELEINLIQACDKSFYGKENVISGDCIVIENAKSWIPFYTWIVEDYAKEHKVWLVDLRRESRAG